MLLTRLPLTPKSAFDLHVLSLPPAFVLSQDQTLRFNEIDRLYLVTLDEVTPSSTPEPSRVWMSRLYVSSKRKPPKSRSDRLSAVPQDLAVHVSLSSYSIFKERGTKVPKTVARTDKATTRISPGRELSPIERSTRAKSLAAGGSAALVGERFIVGGLSPCQQRVSEIFKRQLFPQKRWSFSPESTRALRHSSVMLDQSRMEGES